MRTQQGGISLANLVLTAAVILTSLFVGSYFFLGNNPDLQANLSLIAVTYVCFIWPAYFVLRITERKPIPALAAPSPTILQLRSQQTPIQKDILRDMGKYVYLKETHMQDQLHALNLGVKGDPELPKLVGYREEERAGRYALVLQFSSPHVPLAKWQGRQDKLDRFFGKDVVVETQAVAPDQIELALVCRSSSSRN